MTITGRLAPPCVTGRDQGTTPGKQDLSTSGKHFARSGAGIRRCRRTVIAAIVALVFLPIEASDAGWLSDIFKGSSKTDKAPKQSAVAKHANPRKPVTPAKLAARAKPAASSKPHNVRLAALGPVALSPSAFKPAAPTCDPAKFRIVVDVGHTAESGGANSARNVAEFLYNHRLARRIE